MNAQQATARVQYLQDVYEAKLQEERAGKQEETKARRLSESEQRWGEQTKVCRAEFEATIKPARLKNKDVFYVVDLGLFVCCRIGSTVLYPVVTPTKKIELEA